MNLKLELSSVEHRLDVKPDGSAPSLSQTIVWSTVSMRDQMAVYQLVSNCSVEHHLDVRPDGSALACLKL